MSDPFRLVSFPQDMMIADKEGRLTPSWYRALSGLTGLIPKLNEDSARQDAALTQAETSLSTTDSMLSASIQDLSSGFGQDPVADIDTTPILDVSATYSQTQVTAIKDRLLAAELKINAILAVLRIAQIIGEEE